MCLLHSVLPYNSFGSLNLNFTMATSFKFSFSEFGKKNLKKNREHVTENLCKISHSKKVVWEFLLPNFPTIYQIISNNNTHNCSIMTILILASLDPFVFEIVWDLRWKCNMYEENSFSTTTTTRCDPSIMIPIYKKKKLHLNAIIMHILFHLSQQLKRNWTHDNFLF